jgi:thiamine pyrophosphokinase
MRHEHAFLPSSGRRHGLHCNGNINERSLASSCTKSEANASTAKTALVVLNMPIKATLSMPHEYTKVEEDSKSHESSLFERLWRASDVRVCADGGANRLYDATILPWSQFQGKDSPEENTKESNPYLPNAIVGDLDSIRPEVRDHYQTYGHGLHHNLGCRIVPNLDDSCNDFDKCLQYIQAQQEETMSKSSMDHASLKHDTCFNKWKVYVYGAFDGRFDQTMASTNKDG